MNDRRDEPISDEELSLWIRRHPEVWHYARSEASEPDPVELESLIESILSGEYQARRQRDTRKRRRFVIGGAVGAVVLGTDGRRRPADSRVLPNTERSAELLLSYKPIRSCSQPVSIPSKAAANSGRGACWATTTASCLLSPCISPEGIINVFPGQPGVCASLGLDPAEAELSPENEAIVALKDSLESTINLGECRPAAAAAEKAGEIIGDSGLQGWSVASLPASSTGLCGKVAIDSTTGKQSPYLRFQEEHHESRPSAFH